MKRLNSIINTSIGNILEWYDFGLFSIFAPTFSKIFFPATTAAEGILTTFSIFAVGFLCRPLGAMLFGYFGDRLGRARTLRLSILMMSLPTLCIAFLPTYAQAGILAPLGLLVVRMWQGISIGGEYSGSLIYLAESAPPKNRAFITSFASTGANFGILLAALVGVVFSRLVSEDEILEVGWRYPYLISGIISLLVYFFRLKLKETPIFIHMREQKLVSDNPIKEALVDYRIPLLRSFGMVCMGTTFYYFIFTYLPVFLVQTKNTALNHITFMMMLCMIFMVMIIPLVGKLCDYIGRRKLLLANSLMISIALIPGFYVLNISVNVTVVAVMLLYTLLSSFEQGTTTVSVIENFPSVSRYLGVAIAYNLANGFLGGTVPLILTWLSQNLDIFLIQAIYIECFAIITFLVIYFFVPETKGEPL